MVDQMEDSQVTKVDEDL